MKCHTLGDKKYNQFASTKRITNKSISMRSICTNTQVLHSCKPVAVKISCTKCNYPITFLSTNRKVLQKPLLHQVQQLINHPAFNNLRPCSALGTLAGVVPITAEVPAAIRCLSSAAFTSSSLPEGS